MAIRFKVLEVPNKLNDKSSHLAYATQVSHGRVEINELSQMISERSALSRADVKAVLDNLSWISKFLLFNGMSVSLGDLGSLHTRIRSKATPTAKEFTVKNIRGASLIYRPGRELREAIRQVSFTPFVQNGTTPMPSDGEHPAFDQKDPTGKDSETPTPSPTEGDQGGLA